MKRDRFLKADVFIENVSEGYRVWCGRCGREEIVIVTKHGMPIEALVAWTKAINNAHSRCKPRATVEVAP